MVTLKYEAEDGKLFDSLEKAERYEKRLKKLDTAINKIAAGLYSNPNFDGNSFVARQAAEIILSNDEILAVISEFLADAPASGQEKV